MTEEGKKSSVERIEAMLKKMTKDGQLDRSAEKRLMEVLERCRESFDVWDKCCESLDIWDKMEKIMKKGEAE